MTKKKHIIAIGGGGFMRDKNNQKIEKYILSISKHIRPNICFIPTASGDSNRYIARFYEVFSKLNCNPSHITFFDRTIDLQEHINNQEIIFVGGGNTKSMLGVWREWGLTEILKKAYWNGIIMSGVSAGAICWFESGITDSWSEKLEIIDCLGLINGCCCPHFDEEKERSPFVEKVLQTKQSNFDINSCFCIDGGCALHLIDGKPHNSFNFVKDKGSYLIKRNFNKKNIQDLIIEKL